VTDFEVGNRSLLLATRFLRESSSYTQYQYLLMQGLLRLPNSRTLLTAFSSGGTAWDCLVTGNLQVEESISRLNCWWHWISIAVQLAKSIKGAMFYNMQFSKNLDLSKLGTNRAIDYKNENFAEIVSEAE